jgi:Transglycosylase SLT domain
VIAQNHGRERGVQRHIRARALHRIVSLGLLACALAGAGNAHAQFICQDPWGNVYRLPTAYPALTCAPASSAPEASDGEPTKPEAAAGTLALSVSSSHRPGQLLMRVERSTTGPDPRHDDALEQLIVSTAARYGHEASLLKAIVHVESRFNAAAVSPKGAIGLMQLMPATARDLGVANPATSLFDPAVNLDAGARLLRQLLDRFADRPDLAIAAYNAGLGAVLKHGREIPPYPETLAYVRDVTAEFTRLKR